MTGETNAEGNEDFVEISDAVPLFDPLPRRRGERSRSASRDHGEFSIESGEGVDLNESLAHLPLYPEDFFHQERVEKAAASSASASSSEKGGTVIQTRISSA